jgi:hypothetical protein
MARAGNKSNVKKAKGKKTKREVKKVDKQMPQNLMMNWVLSEQTRVRKLNREKAKRWREKKKAEAEKTKAK